jgi:hypothetical protein
MHASIDQSQARAVTQSFMQQLVTAVLKPHRQQTYSWQLNGHEPLDPTAGMASIYQRGESTYLSCGSSVIWQRGVQGAAASSSIDQLAAPPEHHPEMMVTQMRAAKELRIT